MAIDPDCLRQHLELAAQAYGSDLTLSVRHVEPTARPNPEAVPEPIQVERSSVARSVAAPPVATPRITTPLVATPLVAAELQTVAANSTGSAANPRATPPPPTQPSADAADQVAALQALRSEVMPCTRCKLHQGRQNVVFGEGHANARVLFVGEAPGAVEDQTGRPFVGPAGQLLDRILQNAMGLQRSDVYIANINKCRPPGNREPEPDEVAACLPFLRQQVEIVRPEVIVCLGRTAAQNLLGSTESTRALRGRTHDYAGIPVIVTWHPAYLLRDPSHKRETWDDIKRVNSLLGRPEVPPAPVG